MCEGCGCDQLRSAAAGQAPQPGEDGMHEHWHVHADGTAHSHAHDHTHGESHRHTHHHHGHAYQPAKKKRPVRQEGEPSSSG